MGWAKDFLVQYSTYVKWKVVIDEKLKIMNHACGIRLPESSKMAVDRKNDTKVTIYLDKVIVIFFM